MVAYNVKAKKLAATDYNEARKKVRHIFRELEAETHRKPHIRSAYFKKEKVFFDFYYKHLDQKPKR